MVNLYRLNDTIVEILKEHTIEAAPVVRFEVACDVLVATLKL